MTEVTILLAAAKAGRPGAEGELWEAVYQELRRMAGELMSRESREVTLSGTALLHEAWLRLAGSDESPPAWESRGHFFTAAAEAMRRILVDHARARLTEKRGCGDAAVSLDEAVDVSDERTGQLLALNDALERLAEIAPERSRVVELKYFGGMTLEETAEVLGVSRAKVIREWRMAKAWLYGELTKEL